MQVSGKTLSVFIVVDGHCIQATVQDNVPVRSLESFLEVFPLEKGTYSFAYEGQSLDLDRSLRSYGIESGATIEVIFTPISNGEESSFVTTSEGVIYPVWFGTNRVCLPKGNDFGNSLDRQQHYGKVEVFIPRSHQIGSLGSSWLKRLLTREDDRLKIHAVECMNPDAFDSNLSEHINGCDSQDVLLYVHGYASGFEGVAKRAAQIGYDIQFGGTMCFYSWASANSSLHYHQDQRTIKDSVEGIANFVDKLSEHAHRVHILVHSMGGRGVLKAVSTIVKNSNKLGHLIFAASDVKRSKFIKQLENLKKFMHVTVYLSRKDMALKLSEHLPSHWDKRLGQGKASDWKKVRTNHLSVIDSVNFSIGLLGHSYYAEAYHLLYDIRQLLHGHAPTHETRSLFLQHCGAVAWQLVSNSKGLWLPAGSGSVFWTELSTPENVAGGQLTLQKYEMGWLGKSVRHLKGDSHVTQFRILFSSNDVGHRVVAASNSLDELKEIYKVIKADPLPRLLPN